MQPVHQINPPADFKLKQTVGDLLADCAARGIEVPMFFEEYIDKARTKGIGQLNIAASDLPTDRVIGAYGKRTVTFTAPVVLDKGHRTVRVFASVKKPVVCDAYIAPLMYR